MPQEIDTWLTLAPQWIGALATVAAVIAAVWIARQQIAISKKQTTLSEKQTSLGEQQIAISEKQTTLSEKQTAISEKLVQIEQFRERAANAANLIGYVDYGGVNDTERVLYVINTGGERAVDVEVILDKQPAVEHDLVRGVFRRATYGIPNFVDPKGKIKIRLVTPDDYIHVPLELRWKSNLTPPDGGHWSDVIQVYPAGRQSSASGDSGGAEMA